MSGEISMGSSNKINGFDKYEIESAARTLIEAQKILADKRPKFKQTVSAEVTKQAKAAEEAALVAKTTERMTKVFSRKKK